MNPDEIDVCPVCGSKMEMQTCQQCKGKGVEPTLGRACPTCESDGFYYTCPNYMREDHLKIVRGGAAREYLVFKQDDWAEEKLAIIEVVDCSKCHSKNLDVFIVEGDAYEQTQAYKCRDCGYIHTFGVSE